MDFANVKSEYGTTDYYLNRLIQRALSEPKPLLKIYEEECQRLPDISLTVTFKNFQTALQKYRMTLLSRNTLHPPLGVKQRDHLTKQNNVRNSPSAVYSDSKRKMQRLDIVPPAQMYQRLPLLHPDRFSPQGSLFSKNGFPPPPVSDAPYTATSATQQAPAQPVEEEAPPEFIEMSTNPPRICDNTKFSDYQMQLTGEQSVVAAAAPNCKPDLEGGGKTIDGAVQSSSPPNNNNVLVDEQSSPLNVRCVKCITALVTCAVIPCGHCCLCGICGQTVLSLKQVCPVCRKSITTVIGYSNLIYNVYR